MGSRLALGVVLWLVLGASPAAGQASMVPVWFARDGAVLAGEREGTLPDTEALFAAAAPATVPEPLASALLLCHAEASESGPRGRWDAFADPDLRVELQLGRFRGTAWGPENSREAYVSFAAVALRAGDRIEARVSDRDVTGDERIDTLRGRFDGAFPIVLEHGTTRLTCALGDAAHAAEAAAAALAEAEVALVAVEHAQPSLTDPALGRPVREDPEASGGIAVAMGWAGLHDARALVLASRLSASRRAFDRALTAAVARARREAGDEAATIPGTSTHVRVASVLTATRAIHDAYPDASTPGCVIELVLDSPLTDDDAFAILGTPDVVDGHGSVTSSFGAIRSSRDPARVGLSFSARPRDGLVRVGTGVRAILALP